MDSSDLSDYQHLLPITADEILNVLGIDLKLQRITFKSEVIATRTLPDDTVEHCIKWHPEGELVDEWQRMVPESREVSMSDLSLYTRVLIEHALGIKIQKPTSNKRARKKAPVEPPRKKHITKKEVRMREPIVTRSFNKRKNLAASCSLCP